ncbi:MAG: hypothetical protein FWB93_05495, partial [Oscillospiraceae bacterium]|nr:hypothetical protein [Oscillospiraceae bacterium]
MSDKLRNRRLFAKMQGYEGLYVLEQHASVAEGNKFLRHRKSMHLRALLKEYLEENNYRLKHESLVEYLDLAQSQHKFDDSELFAVNDMISDLILRRLSESDNPLGDTVLVENCVRTMQQMDVCQFEKMYTQLSEVNAILSEHNLDFYVDCDEQTKRAMRSEVYRYARRHRISEVESAHLYCKRFSRDNGKMGRIYFIAYVALTVAFFVVAVGFSGIIAALLLLIPISEVCRIVVHGVVARFVHPRPIPKLRPTAIPDQAKTLVVITSMLFSNEDTTALMRRLETIYHQNSDPNARFGILADLPESDSYHTREDDALIAHAEGAIGELNSRLGEHFCLFVRSRQQSATHPKPRFSGWERKRGAVIELTRLTRGIQGNFAAKIAPESFLLDTKYIITLDADTNMYIGAVRDFVFTMLHPSNKPVVRNGIVVEGYGVLQPRMATSLSAASATPFSVMISGAGGMDSYQTASFDCYQSLFGEGIFCGKGIFDVDVFLEVVDGAFPEQRVLSHDLLEGTRLRCGLLTELSLTDSCPKTPASFFTRQHRWIRGDVQAAAFAGRKVRNDRGRKVTNPISALSRYMLIDNIRRTLLPILTIAAILKAFFTNYSVFFVTLVALAWLIMPFIFSSVRTARNVNRRFYSTVMQGIWRGFMEFLYAVMSMPHTAILAADAMVRSLWRMVFSRRRLLEWTTAAQSDRSSNNGFFFYYRKMFPSFVAGAIMLFAAPHGMFRLFGVMFALLPLVSYFISRPLQNTPKADGEVKQILSGYARDTWAFYEAFVTAEDNWLPPDNYQELPVEVVAHRTSPTNIAMYMLSTLAAADFGFIGSSELYQRLYDTCSTIEGMVKYRGQLYNWYDTRTLDVIGVPYVSTVDNGNFVTSLLALAQGLEEYALQEPRLDDVIDKLNKFIDESDFSFLYNPDRHLFCIGYDTLREEQSENCYDLLMSEARSTSYFAIARGIVPKEHWHRLGRPTISGGGHIGMASWSGTAFEYFMPPLLLPISKNSLMYECLGFALVEQKLHAHTAPSHSDGKPLSLWGKSESGYFAFDGDMNYQYRAIGTRTLALEMAAGRDNVISPYSSFLSLCIAPNTSIENLQKLKEFGMYGKYGFFEAVDFTPSRVGGGNAIIRSYMAHHVGMSMLAAANVCFDNVFQNRFMSDPQMRAAAELLEERVPTDARVSRDNRRRRLAKRELPGVKQRRIVLPEDLGHTNEGELPQTALISNGSTMLYASSAGDVTLMARQSRSHKAAAITYPFFDGVPGLRTLRLLGGFDGKVVDLLREDATRFSYSGSKARYTYSDKTLSTKAEFSVLGDGAAVNINITAEGKFTSFTPMLALEPILFGVDEFQSHPAFCGLSVTAEYDKKAGVLLFCRRSRRSKEKEAWFAISL